MKVTLRITEVMNKVYKKCCLIYVSIMIFRVKYLVENLGYHEVKIIIPPWWLLPCLQGGGAKSQNKSARNLEFRTV